MVGLFIANILLGLIWEICMTIYLLQKSSLEKLRNYNGRLLTKNKLGLEINEEKLEEDYNENNENNKDNKEKDKDQIINLKNQELELQQYNSEKNNEINAQSNPNENNNNNNEAIRLKSALNNENLSSEENNKNINNSKVTFVDYDHMDAEQVKEKDQRKAGRMFCDYLYIRHDLSFVFIYPNIMVPFHIRISYLFFSFYIDFCINAMTFNDDLIENRNLESNPTLIDVGKLT